MYRLIAASVLVAFSAAGNAQEAFPSRPLTIATAGGAKRPQPPAPIAPRAAAMSRTMRATGTWSGSPFPS